MYFVSAAFVVSALAVLCIIILDRVADRLEQRSDTEAQRLLKRFEAEHLHSGLHRGLRIIISALGLCVGLSWEKAFDMAHEAIAEGTPAIKHHPVIAKFAIAVLVVGT